MIMAVMSLIVEISGLSIVQVDDNGRRIGSCVTYLHIHTHTFSSQQVQCSITFLIVQFSGPYIVR